MSSNPVDLSLSGVVIPDLAVIDTNVIVAYFQSFFSGQLPTQSNRATTFFQQLLTAGQFVILPPTAYGELIHLAAKDHYANRVRGNRQSLSTQYGAPITNWLDLYKRDPAILKTLQPNLTLLREGLMNSNVVIAEPTDLDYHRAPQLFSTELIARMTRYGLDTADALILMETHLLGIEAIITMDRDLHWATSDFTIYTWL